MSLRDALEALHESKRGQIEQRLEVLNTSAVAIVRKLFNNIRDESRVPYSVWINIFAALLSVDMGPDGKVVVKELCAALQKCFSEALPSLAESPRIPSRKPVGPRLDGLYPRAYGRIVSLRQLTSLWRLASTAAAETDTTGRYPPDDEYSMRAWIAKLTDDRGFKTRQASGSLSRCPLGAYIMWSTFNAENPELEPFHPRPLAIRKCVGTLGLDSPLLGLSAPEELALRREASPGSCVVLSYTLPPSISPHVPTIVEAYAGAGGMNYYFEVCRHPIDVRNSKFPRTMPTKEFQNEEGRPEVVHSVVFGSALVSPIEFYPL
jgi:hypothetical protein